MIVELINGKVYKWELPREWESNRWTYPTVHAFEIDADGNKKSGYTFRIHARRHTLMCVNKYVNPVQSVDTPFTNDSYIFMILNRRTMKMAKLLLVMKWGRSEFSEFLREATTDEETEILTIFTANEIGIL